MNPLLLTAGFFAGGPAEDAYKMFTAKEGGTILGTLTKPLGQENTKMEAGLEMLIGIGTSMLPMQARIPVAGALALCELCTGDWGDALGHLLFALPLGKGFNIKSLKSGAKLAQKEALRLAKVLNKSGGKALASELGIHSGKLTIKAQKYASPFLDSFTKTIRTAASPA